MEISFHWIQNLVCKLKKIVFIDDDDINNFLVKDQLETYGFHGETVFFDAALDALDYLRKLQSDLPIESPDIIFLDIKMPFMDGFDFLEAFKELHLNLYLPSKIFMVSSSTNEQDIQRSKDSGIVVDCIEKPLSIAHLERIAELHFS